MSRAKPFTRPVARAVRRAVARPVRDTLSGLPSYSATAYRAATSGSWGRVTEYYDSSDSFAYMPGSGTVSTSLFSTGWDAATTPYEGFCAAFVDFASIPAWSAISAATLRLRGITSYGAGVTVRGYLSSSPSAPADTEDFRGWMTGLGGTPVVTTNYAETVSASSGYTHTLDVKAILEELAEVVGWNFPATMRFVIQYPVAGVDSGFVWSFATPAAATDANRPELTITAAL